MRLLHAIDGTLATLVRWITSVLTGALVIIVTGNVVARYIFRFGVPWIEELTRILFVWVVFLGACVAMHHRGHLAVAFVVNRMPPTLRKATVWLTNALSAIFLGAIAWGGWQLITSTINYGSSTPTLGLSFAWGFAAIPVSALIMLITLVTQTLDGTDEQPTDDAAVEP